MVKDAVRLTMLYGPYAVRMRFACGVPVYSVNALGAVTPGEVCQCINEALDLIRLNDAYRYRIVAQQVRIFLNRIDIAAARYIPLRKVCAIDMEALRAMCNELDIPRVPYCAALIIHEASHGYLLDRGIPHAPRDRKRTEQICNRQAVKFLRTKLRIKARWVKIFELPIPAARRRSVKEKWKLAMERIREIAKGS